MTTAGGAALLSVFNEAWGWTAPPFVAISEPSRFGHCALEDGSGAFWYFDPDMVELTRVAVGQNEMARYFEQSEVREVWEALELRAQAEALFGTPPPGSVYHWKIPPILGGDFSPENMCILPLDQLIRFTGDVALQMKDLPDGQQVRLKVVE